MRSDELITLANRGAFLPPNHPTYPEAVWLQELNDALSQIFPDLVTVSRQGYWQHLLIVQCTAGRARYRVPARAMTGILEKVEINTGDGTFAILQNVTENHAQYYESFNGQTGTPAYYVHRADQVELLPEPSTSSMQLRLTYYLRPSKLVRSQSSVSGGDGVIRGRIINMFPEGGGLGPAVQVNLLPFDQSLAAPAAISSGLQRVDIIKDGGWYETILVSCTQTIAATTLSFPIGTNVDGVELGDWVRAEQQTDWPCLPEDYHRALADVAAVKVLLQQNLVEKASALATSAGGDIARLAKLLSEPRTRRAPKRMGALLRTRGIGVWPRWRS